MAVATTSTNIEIHTSTQQNDDEDTASKLQTVKEIK